MMEMEEYEDVTFQNSAFHRYLQEAGVDAIDAVERLPVTDIKCLKDEVSITKHTGKQSEKSFARTGLMTFLDYVKAHLRLWRNSNKRRELEREYYRQISDRLRSSTLMEDDDTNFLDAYLGPINKSAAITQSYFTFFSFPTFFVLMIAVIVTRGFLTQSHWQELFYTDAVTVLITCCILLQSGNTVFFILKRRKLAETVQRFDDFMKVLEEFQIFLKKSVRLVQETELVARGFTLVLGPVPATRLEANQQTERQCPDLRRNIFLTARNAFSRLRASTVKLLKISPHISGVDNNLHYLATIPWHDFGKCLQVNDAELSEATDKFALSALKAMVNLYHLQKSEFLRRLTLSFPVHRHAAAVSGKAKVIVPLRKLESLVLSTLDHISDEFTRLNQSYEYHQAMTCLNQGEITSPGQELSGKVSGLYTAVHSLDLHLQAALRKVRNLSEEVETYAQDQAKEQDLGTGHEEHWTYELRKIGAEMDSCKSCWQEAETHLSKCFGTSKKPCTGVLSENKSNDKSDTCARDEKSSVHLIAATDPIITDEVFEAYIDTEPDDYSSYSQYDDFLSVEEKAKKKQERETANRMLTELKSVIAEIAVERKKREERALEAMRVRSGFGVDSSGTNTLTSHSDISDNNTNSNQISDRSKLDRNKTTSDSLCYSDKADKAQEKVYRGCDNDRKTLTRLPLINDGVGGFRVTQEPLSPLSDSGRCSEKSFTESPSTDFDHTSVIGNNQGDHDLMVLTRKTDSTESLDDIDDIDCSNTVMSETVSSFSTAHISRDLAMSQKVSDGNDQFAISERNVYQYSDSDDEYISNYSDRHGDLYDDRCPNQYKYRDDDNDISDGSMPVSARDLSSRLQRVMGMDLSLASSVAAEAVARSRSLNLITTETYGDDDSEEEEEGKEGNEDIADHQ